MNIWQNSLVILVAIYSLIAFIKGYRETKIKRNPYGLSKWFNPISAFVWADAVIFGLFFLFVSIFILLIQDFILLLLIFSVFWTVRSIGESVYWFLEQYADNHRNPEHTLWMNKWFPRNSVWIANQIFNQCIAVVGIISSAYLFKLWIF